MEDKEKYMITGFPDVQLCPKCHKRVRFPYIICGETQEELRNILKVVRKNILHLCNTCFKQAELDFRKHADKFSFLEYRLLHNENPDKDFIVKFKSKEDFEKFMKEKKEG